MRKTFTHLCLLTALWLSGMSASAIDVVDGVYRIGTAEDLAEFSALIENGSDQVNAILTADITYDGAPVGGKKAFHGVFDGQGHKITLNQTRTSQGGGLFWSAEVPCTVKNLTVDGVINTSADKSGAFGFYGSGAFINCVAAVTINSTYSGDASHGGFVANGYDNTRIINCVSATKINGGGASKNAGGFIGWANNTACRIVNSVCVAEIDDMGAGSGSNSIARHGSGNTPTVVNTYFLNKLDVADGAAQQTTAEALTDGTVLAALNSYDATLQWTQGEAYPVPVANSDVYVISTPEDLVLFSEHVGKGNISLSACVKADLDMTGVEMTPIGSDTWTYRAKFDGEGHTISNLNIKGSSAATGLFGTIAAGARIQNLVLDETCSITGFGQAGLIGHSTAVCKTYLQNLGNLGSVTSSGNGVAGIIGNCNAGSVCVIDHCWSAGKIVGNGDAAAICGWINTNGSSITNCWSISEVSGIQDAAHYFYRFGTAPTASGNYCIAGTQTPLFEADDVMSGKLCYLYLNGGSSENPTWFQTLDGKSLPTVFGKDVVYCAGAFNCDGTDKGTVSYNNDGGSSVIDPHDMVDGICSVCGQLEKDGGYFLIPSAKALKWYADYVNAGNSYANARLTADIDMTGVEWTPISDDSNHFKGVFDGQGHKISNLVFDNGDYANPVGLFGTANGATFRNFYLDETCSFNGNAKYMGGVVGHSTSGPVTFEHVGFAGSVVNTCVINDCGTAGILGNANGGSLANFDYCWVAGHVEGQVDVAAFSAWEGNVGAHINNCWAVADLNKFQDDAHYLARCGASFTVANTYTNKGTQGTIIDIDETMLHNGELCFKLNGDQSKLTWYQNLDAEGVEADEFPVAKAEGHAVVYANGDLSCDGSPLGSVSYSNTQTTNIPDHEIEHGFCIVCGSFIKDYKKPVDDFFILEDANDVVWFSEYANTIDAKANARLAADINMAEAERDFNPLGIKNAYAGTFDGQNHVVSNLTVDMLESNAGFISVGAGGMILKNIIFDKSCSIKTGNRYAGIVGISKGGETGTLTFINVGNEGEVTAAGENAGGLIGCNSGSSAKHIFRNCYTTGTITGGKESAALSGWSAANCEVAGCWTTATVNGAQEGRELVRYSSGLTMTDTYSIEGMSAQGTPFTKSEMESGEFCYKLNGNSFTNPIWYQRLGDDAYPGFNPERGVVYCYGYDECQYADVHDDASLEECRNNLIATEQAEAEDAIACKEVVDAYCKRVTVLEDAQTISELQAAYRRLMTEKQDFLASKAAYKAYVDYCNYAITYLEENDFFCAERTVLEDYLQNNEEGSEQYPNGTYLYIKETHTLTDADIQKETEFVQQMLNTAIAKGIKAGTEVTDLMANANFAADLDGWTVETNKAAWMGGVKDVMPAGEFYDAKFNVSQTVEGLPNGIYELRANAVYRPGSDIYSTFYVGRLYAGDNMNYVMVSGEDVVSKEDAVDGVNCHISGDAQDYGYVYGVQDGYVPFGPVSCSYAFSAGRYVNYTAVEVKDGTLTVGICNPGSDITSGKDWMGFGGFRLFYLGTADEASERLDDVLQGYADRAQTIVDFEWSDLNEIEKYPHMSEALVSEIQDAIDAVESCESGEEKMQLIKKFSDLFAQVLECRKAYIALVDKAETMFQNANALQIEELISSEAMDDVIKMYEDAWNAYVEGSLSKDEALEFIGKMDDLMSEFSIRKVDGAYQLATAQDVCMFSLFVNNGEFNANAVLTADIDFEGVEFTPIGFDRVNPTGENANYLYVGKFDGQGHHIKNLVINMPDNIGVGMFGTLGIGAEIKNMVLESSCVITGKDRAGIIGRSRDGGVIRLTNLGNEGDVIAGRAAAGILGNANAGSIAYIENCYSTGNITTITPGQTNVDCSQICGWLGNVGAKITGCWSTATISGYQDLGHVFCRLGGNVTFTGNYSTVGDGTNLQANMTPVSEFERGAVTFALNDGNTENPIWCQTLGSDMHPVFNDGKAYVVLSDGKGEFYNAEDPDAVTTLPATHTTTSAGIYDLTGRRVKKAVKGLYIVNGQKLMVK